MSPLLPWPAATASPARSPAGATHGEHPGFTSSWYNRVFEQNPALKVAAAGLAAVGTLGLVASLARRTAHRNGNGHLDAGLRSIGMRS
ncbi:hypothetical protein [Aquisphaera insulae]|uniref:hypothetical protein n=1 Tax=Aquisphaera insulae TaxID=2712864 RepID=UPI0013ED0254|nr:hypothetical protein [Aquisphaera insulae]